MRFLFLLLSLCLLPVVAPLHAQREKLPPDDLAFVQKNWPQAKKTNTGVRYIVLKEGSGKPPSPGDLVSVLYEGRRLDGTVFDKTENRDRPISVRVGRQMVIDGWDQILKQMTVGEKRLVIIPPELAYGTRGHDNIPPDTTLVFEMEVVAIKRVE